MDQLDELLAILPGFPLSYTLAVVQFLEGDRILDGHILQRRIPEYDPRLQVQLPGHVLAQALEHREEGRVAASTLHGSLVVGHVLVIIVIRPLSEEYTVLHQTDLIRILVELLSLLGDEEQPVCLDLLVKEMEQQSLMDDYVPELLAVCLTGSEQRQGIVLV